MDRQTIGLLPTMKMVGNVATEAPVARFEERSASSRRADVISHLTAVMHRYIT